LGPFGCIKTAIFSENANLSKTRFWENLPLPTFHRPPGEEKKNVSQFSINIHILNIDGKFLKIKIILPNWLWKVGKVLSYFLRKSDIFFQKYVKN